MSIGPTRRIVGWRRKPNSPLVPKGVFVVEPVYDGDDDAASVIEANREQARLTEEQVRKRPQHKT